MQMERPSSIAMPAPWYSMTSDISWINRESNTPTPTSENPTASFGTLGFSAASEKDPIFTWDHPQIHQSKQQQQLHSKGPLEEQEEQEEEEEEVAWSAASLQSSFSGQIHDPCGDLYAPDESDEEPDFVAPLPSQWSHNMRRSSSCYYASESSEPSRLLHGTSGGAGMVRSFSNPIPSMATCQNEQAAAFQREAHQIEEQEKWSPVKFTASTTQDLPNYSLGAENTPLTASSLYNNPYHPITAADRVLQPHSYQNSRSDSPNRPRLGRFLSFEPSISAREHASL